MNEKTNVFKKMTSFREFGVLVALLALVVIFAFSSPIFLSGENMYYWDRYAVYDNNKIVAYISGRPSGRLISQTLVEGNSELPHFIVDECNNRRIKELLEKNIKVTVEGEAKTYTKADMRGCDLVLPLKAEKPQAGKIINLRPL